MAEARTIGAPVVHEDPAELRTHTPPRLDRGLAQGLRGTEQMAITKNLEGASTRSSARLGARVESGPAVGVPQPKSPPATNLVSEAVRGTQELIASEESSAKKTALTSGALAEKQPRQGAVGVSGAALHKALANTMVHSPVAGLFGGVDPGVSEPSWRRLGNDLSRARQQYLRSETRSPQALARTARGIIDRVGPREADQFSTSQLRELCVLLRLSEGAENSGATLDGTTAKRALAGILSRLAPHTREEPLSTQLHAAFLKLATAPTKPAPKPRTEGSLESEALGIALKPHMRGARPLAEKMAFARTAISMLESRPEGAPVDDAKGPLLRIAQTFCVLAGPIEGVSRLRANVRSDPYSLQNLSCADQRRYVGLQLHALAVPKDESTAFSRKDVLAGLRSWLTHQESELAAPIDKSVVRLEKLVNLASTDQFFQQIDTIHKAIALAEEAGVDMGGARDKIAKCEGRFFAQLVLETANRAGHEWTSDPDRAPGTVASLKWAVDEARTRGVISPALEQAAELAASIGTKSTPSERVRTQHLLNDLVTRLSASS